MNTIEEIKNKVLSGYVLDDNGQWIKLSERIKIEKDIVKNVIEGKVLFDNSWTPVSDVLKSSLKNKISPPQETKAIFGKRTPKNI